MASPDYTITSRITRHGLIYAAHDRFTGRFLAEVQADKLHDAQLRLAALVREVRAGK